MPLAMQTGTGVPSAPASVQQEGPRGPAGRGHACYHQQKCFVVNSTNYGTEHNILLRGTQVFTSQSFTDVQNLGEVICRRTKP